MIRRNAIFFLIDKNIFPAAIFQATRLASLNPRDDTDICVISDSANDVALAKDFAAPCRIIYLDPSMVKVPMNQAYASRVSYYRAYVPSLLAGEYRRILHLDTDIAIENDKIFSLFDIEMGGHPIAAVRDAMVAYSNVPANVAELKSTLRKGGRKYLNNGMALIDSDRFVGLGLETRTIAAISKSRTPLSYANQTAINATLNGNWLELSPAFNMMVPLWKSFVREVCAPTIVHFAGPAKPWHGPRFAENHRVKAEMEQFFRGTPWKGFLASFFNVKDVLQQVVAVPGLGPTRTANKPTSLPSIEMRPNYDMPGFVRYLAETPFADVLQGVTSLDLGKIPAQFR